MIRSNLKHLVSFGTRKKKIFLEYWLDDSHQRLLCFGILSNVTVYTGFLSIRRDAVPFAAGTSLPDMLIGGQAELMS